MTDEEKDGKGTEQSQPKENTNPATAGDTKTAEAGADKANKPAADAKPKVSKERERALEVMAQVGAEVIYRNASGEFFTEQSRALLSEGGKASRVTTFKRNEK